MKSKMKLKIYTRHPNHFLQGLIDNHVSLYDIEIKKDYLIIMIEENDYEKIAKKKTIKKIVILNYYGLKKIKILIKKYKVWIISFIIQLILIIIVSNLILTIDVQTTNPILKQNILNYLKENGIKKYAWKKSYTKKEKIKKEILKKHSNEIEWMEIKEVGTKYIITIEPKKTQNNPIECLARNLVAKKSSTITRIESISGEIIKKKQDFVEKGEVIVSGLIHNKETIVATRCVEGKVYGEVWYQAKISLPKQIEKRIKTGHHKWEFIIQIPLISIKSNKKYLNYEKNEYNLIKSNLFPLQLGMIQYEEIKIQTKTYTKNELEEIAYQTLLNKIKSSTSSNPVVLSKKVLKKYTNNSKIIIEVFLSTEEDITEYQIIDETNIEELNKGED